MALHPDFPDSPYAVLNPEVRWFPTAETLRETHPEKLMPPLVAKLRREVKTFRDSGYADASPSSRSLLRWWFREPHLLERADGRREEFRYFFAQREAVETIVYLYDAAGVRDKYDLMRFDGSRAVSAGMFDETWRRFVVKMATGSGKTKVLSLVLAWSYFHKLYEPGSALARNFLVIAPNIIVLDRLYRDFRGLRIFFADPVLPDNGFDDRNWRDDFQLRLHVQDQVRVTAPTGNVFLDQHPPRICRQRYAAVAGRRQQHGLFSGAAADRSHDRLESGPGRHRAGRGRTGGPERRGAPHPRR